MAITLTGRKSGWIDWETERERIDLAAFATGLLGPPPGRRGEKGRRFWWSCPLGIHEDRNPSFSIAPGECRWRCYGCGEHGDAAGLVMRMGNVSFSEAVEFLMGGPIPIGRDHRTTRRAPTTPGVGECRPEPGPTGLPEPAALALVEAAAAGLWTPEGAKALSYLTGPERCLTPQVIRGTRLGWTPRADGVAWQPAGVVIPWFLGGQLAMVKVRLPDDWRGSFPESRRPPRYLEAFRHPARLLCYPGPEAIRPGRPLIVTEGELDALCLGDAIGELASVVTLGSASSRPTLAILDRFPSDAPWYIATDSDEAGDNAALAWPTHARRIRPPGPFKDWTEARAGGVDLARWWRDILAGADQPPLFTWPELAGWRWGPAEDDPAPGIDRARMAELAG